MRMVEGRTDIADDSPCLGMIQGDDLRGMHYGAEQCAIEQLHGKESDRTIAVELENTQDVRVRQSLHLLERAAQVREQFRALGHPCVRHPDRQALTGGRDFQSILVEGLKNVAPGTL